MGDRFVGLHALALLGGAEALTAAGTPTEVVRLDQLTADIAADPQTFGFLTLDEPILLGFGTNPTIEPTPEGVELSFPANDLVADLAPDQVAFYDFLHPTTALHGVFAAFSAASLTKDKTVLSPFFDFFPGGPDDDFVLARSGSDLLLLGDGDDEAFAGLDNDTVLGGGGNDLAAGGAGNDRLFGGAGHDLLAGNTGDDRAFGGPDADILIGGLGSDHLAGNAGDDLFLYTEAGLIGGVTGVSSDHVDGGVGTDTLVLAVSPSTRDDVAAEIANGGGSAGLYSFSSLNLEARNIENVVLVGERRDLALSASSDDLAELLASADLWGLV